MKVSLTWLLGLVLSQLLTSFSQAADSPNIVLIYTDDQGYGDASCLNSQCKFVTPNLDRLAKEGITFTDGHCSDTVCTPSRYGLLTGRYSWRTGMKTGVMGAEGECLIDEGRVTLASLLRGAGYRTGIVGKWHLGMDFPGEAGNRDWNQPIRDMPLDKGFDYYFGVPASLNYGVLAWFEGRFAKIPPTLFTAKKPNSRHSDYRIAPPYEQSPLETKQVLGVEGMEVAADFVDSQCLTRFTDKAIAWVQEGINQPNAKPFFLYLPLTSPHYPVCPLPEFYDKGAAGGYGEFMIETDYHVGQILKFLDDNQLAHNTIVILTSDNGPENSWKERAEMFQHRSNGIYREGKRSIYEGGHRVPFFVRWPAGIVAPGRQWANPICQTDIFATLADLVGAELPANAGEDSQSFYSVLINETPEVSRGPIIHHAANGRFGIRDEKWKLCLPHENSAAELYDLEADPGETRDLAGSHPDIVRRLSARATSFVVQGRSTPGEPQKNDTDYWDDLTWMSPVEYRQE